MGLPQSICPGGRTEESSGACLETLLSRNLCGVIFVAMSQRELEKKLSLDRKELFSNLRRNIRSKSVLRAMQRVPREVFVPIDERHLSYLDIALPIGEGQTMVIYGSTAHSEEPAVPTGCAVDP